MKHTKLLITAACAAILALSACDSSPTNEASEALSAATAISVQNAWARETAEGQSAGGAFMSVSNNGPETDRLTGGSAPVAAEVQVHTMSMEGGVMRMRRLVDGLQVPAGGKVELKPGGFHIMLLGLKQPLKPGDTLLLKLHFEKAGEVQVRAKVEPVTFSGPSDPTAPTSSMMEGHHE